MPQVVAGDVNAYLDFEWPMDSLAGTVPPVLASDTTLNPCNIQDFPDLAPPGRMDFSDAWTSVYSLPDDAHGKCSLGLPTRHA